MGYVYRRKKKGAFQLSLGFIIGLVFAVILLTLSIMWIRGVFQGFSTMTDDLTQNARAQLANTFDYTQTNFDVSPAFYKLEPGRSVKLSAGVKNNDPSAQVHNFVIKVLPAAADYEIYTAEGCSDFESCTSLQEKMMRWVTYSKYSRSANPNDKEYWDITIRFPNDVKRGSYVFDVVACADVPWDDCDRTSTNKWGRTKQLTIEAK